MKRFTVVATLIALTLGMSVSARAQNTNFGKNKVQYKDFAWKYIQTPHFDIYYYQGGKEIAEFTAEVAEPALESIQKTIHFDITERISLLIYNSHNDFQQTNAVGEYLPEGVGGVTELLKNRVIVPYEGDYAKFRHVIHHELVHAVLNEMYSGGSYQALLTGGGMQIPTWMNEGLAEYISLYGLDPETDMFMRDATVADEVPPLHRLGGYTQYRVGQMMYTYIAEKYGPEKVGELMNRIKTMRSAELGFKTTFGFGIAEFGEKFQDALKKQYYPDLAKYDDPSSFAEIVADHKKLGNFFNSAPVLSPDGRTLAYIRNNDQQFEVWVQDVTNLKNLRRVLSGGGSSAQFEEMHLLAPGLSWTADGKKLLLASKAGRYDAVSIIDVNSGDIDRLPVPNLDGIFQLSASPDGKHLAFIGYKSGASDIYLYNFDTRDFKNLTRDVFSDQDLAWTPDSKTIYFSSDRKDHITPGQFATDGIEHAKFLLDGWKGWDIYSINTADGVITRITASDDHDERNPAVSGERKKLLYLSDANGISNIYASELDGSNSRPLTNSIAKIDQISVSNDGTKLAFCAVSKLGYNLYLFRNPLDHSVDSLPLTKLVRDKQETFAMTDSALTRRAERLTKGTPSDIDTVVGYGDVGIDLSNYVYSDDPRIDRSSGLNIPRRSIPISLITNYKDTATGRYIERDYRVVFTSDVILGTAGYTGYYGLQGTAQMLFSDQLGNHTLYFATNLIYDLKNSDYLLAYYNLEDRINFGVQGFHSARLLYTTADPGYNNEYFISRFTSFGLTGLISYPFDRFTRMDVGVSALVLEKDALYDEYGNTLDIATKTKFAISPSASYIFDNTTWSYFYPNKGTRYNITLAAAPGIGSKFIGFVTPQFDFRHYIPLFGGMSLATRIAGAASFGPNPQKFYLGGVDGWINRFFSETTYALTEPEDFAFYGAAAPLRGYAYDEKIGSKYVLANIAARFPFPILVGGLPLGLFAETFIDAGTAWNNNVYFFQKQPDGSIITRDLLTSTGIGIRTYLFGFYVKMDVAWRTNLDTWSPPEYIFSLGQDF